MVNMNAYFIAEIASL